MPEMKEEKSLYAGTHASETFSLELDENDPTTVYNFCRESNIRRRQDRLLQTQTKWSVRKEPNRWLARKPKDAPHRLPFRLLPSGRTIAHLGGHQRLAERSPTSAQSAPLVRKAIGKSVIKTVEFAVERFAEGRQEMAIELPGLDGEYEIAMKVEVSASPRRKRSKTFERTAFLENFAAGRSTRGDSPFTAIRGTEPRSRRT